MNHLLSFTVLSVLVSITLAGHCNFDSTDASHYQCEFSHQEGELVAITGDHIEGYDDAAVTSLVSSVMFVNNMPRLNRVILDTFPNLENIELTAFGIDSIAPDTFEQGRRLESLDLSLNRLTNFNLSSPTLKVLKVTGNFLTNITGSMLLNLPSLEHLDASINRIATINNSAFIHNPHLTSIDLDHNSLTAFNFNVTRSSQGLRHLNLSHNIISRLSHSGSDVGLTTLDLSFNALNNFPMSTVERLRGLVDLQMAFNEIEVLSAARHILASLVSINLNSNRIMAISRDFFHALPNLADFRAFDNVCIDSRIENSEPVTDQLEECFSAYDELPSITTTTRRNPGWDDDDEGMSALMIVWLVTRILMIALILALIIYFITEIVAMQKRKNAARKQVAVAVIVSDQSAGSDEKLPQYERF